MDVEEKLELLGYKCKYEKTIDLEFNQSLYYKTSGNYNLYIMMRSGKIFDASVCYWQEVKEQEQIDNLQIAYNILKSDLKELGYETNDR